jgi:hypothetical protein
MSQGNAENVSVAAVHGCAARESITHVIDSRERTQAKPESATSEQRQSGVVQTFPKGIAISNLRDARQSESALPVCVVRVCRTVYSRANTNPANDCARSSELPSRLDSTITTWPDSGNTANEALVPGEPPVWP